MRELASYYRNKEKIPPEVRDGAFKGSASDIRKVASHYDEIAEKSDK